MARPYPPRRPIRRPAHLWEVCERRPLMGIVTTLSITAPPPVIRPVDAPTTLDFTVTLSPAVGQFPVTVDYSTANITAVAGADYQAARGTLTFPPNVTTETIPVTILPAAQVGADRTFSVTLANPTQGVQLNPEATSATGTIVSNDLSAGSFLFSSATYDVSAAAGSATITVNRIAGSAGPVTVDFATNGGTAVAGTDFVPVKGTLRFPNGVTSESFTVPVLANPLATSDRFVTVALSNPTNGATIDFQNDTATLTIHPANPLIVTNTNDSGFGSLRNAILAADSIPGASPVRITFDIPGAAPHTIVPATPLPTITRPTTVDATTEPGYAGTPVVAVNGSALPRGGTYPASGLSVTAGDCDIKGLAIGGFPGSGVVLIGGVVTPPPGGPGGGGPGGVTIRPLQVPAGGPCIVEDDYIGTDTAGVAVPNGDCGVLILNSPSNVVRNDVISGNTFAGVCIFGPESTFNAIVGSAIGTDPSRSAAVGNGSYGVVIGGGSSTLIGGTGPGQGDVISGNGDAGVAIFGPRSTGNVVVGDAVGTDAAGSRAVPNGGAGVMIVGAPGNVVGLGVGAANVLSGNGFAGVMISGPGATGNVVQGNLVGTNGAGSATLPNGSFGVLIGGAPGNLVGGPTVADRNVISGNAPPASAGAAGAAGVGIIGAGASGNAVSGNFIGTDATGTRALPNNDVGVLVIGAPNNFVAGNLVSGNGTVGVELLAATATGNRVLGNTIGTDVSGTRALPNGSDGVFLFGAPGNLIGGAAAGAGNLISGNGSVGVQVFGAGASGNVIQGNRIGTDAAGTAAVRNRLDGVFLNGVPGNLVGGVEVGAGNVISGNGEVGVQILGAAATGNAVVGNKVGTDPSGLLALPNVDDGVFLNNAPGNTVGGTASGAGNVISGNGSVGLQVFGPGSTGETVQGNTIGVNAPGSAALGNAFGVFVNGAPGLGPVQLGPGSLNLIRGNRVAQVLTVPAIAGGGRAAPARALMAASVHRTRKG